MTAIVESRRATHDDFDFSWALYEDSVRPLMEPHILDMKSTGWDEQDERQRFSEIWQPDKVLVLISEGEPIGWASIDEAENIVKIENIYIVPKLRGHGLGTTFLNWVISTHRHRPFATSIITGNRSRSLYERLGFREVGRLGFETQLQRSEAVSSVKST